MSEIAAPYPADTKAKGWRFEVDMEAVKASETWLRAKRGDVRGALLLLWAEAWQQTPCGTLPNDDELVALLIDMAMPTFTKHRAVLMRGWWQASDGRLYHDTITARVLAMLDKRANDATRAANRRAKLLASQVGQPEVTSVSRVTQPGLVGEFDTKHQAPSTSTGEKTKPPKAPRKRRAAAAEQLTVSLETIVADGVQQRHAEEWLAIRAKKDLVLTQTAWDDVKAEAVKADLAIDEAIRVAVVRSWGGFMAKWVSVDAPLARASPPANRQEAREQRNRAVADEWAAEGAPQ